MELEPTVVDAGDAGVRLDWYATVRDDLSGLRRAVVFLPETIGSTPAHEEIRFSPGALEETVCGTLTLVRGIPKGVYNVQVFVEDRELNSADYAAGDAFGRSGKGSVSDNGGVRLLCPLGPCKVVNRP